MPVLNLSFQRVVLQLEEVGVYVFRAPAMCVSCAGSFSPLHPGLSPARTAQPLEGGSTG